MVQSGNMTETPGPPDQSPVRLHGFADHEVIDIRSDSVTAASREFGSRMKGITRQVLDEVRSGAGPWDNLEKTAGSALDHFRSLVSSGVFTAGGVDYGKRYLDRLEGFASGAEISPAEAIVLDMELDAGCQTIIVREKGNGRISLIHTEENEGDTALVDINRKRDAGLPFDEAGYRYRIVHQSDGDKTITFLAYPGLSGGGPAMGINRDTGCMVVVDALFTQADTDPAGSVWVNAVAGMFLDAGDIGTARQLAAKMRDRGITFTGGYAVHLARAGNPPQLATFEFGGTHAVEVAPRSLPDRDVIGQPSHPRSKELAGLDAFTVSAESPPKDFETALYGTELARRKRRLELTGALVDLPDETPEARLDRLTRIAANPYSDAERITDETTGQTSSDMTGMPSLWSSAWGVAVIGREPYVVFGKYQAPKLPRKPYGMTVESSDPRKVRAELTELANRRMETEVKPEKP
ncbi:hypothetical protein A2Z33_03680 [Candidatus Gottesmanbacteria bacterium RBG_16_52_11]|uniref:Peptidase C45 n=1 Tax=Candidatus Gottesmanbacteria bacterium RBG_16_52_11 TaxID=1798374 RepID=A0A1F5YVV6_9BACT|nr:MAG: hypothetical protein A2Z33_03680 [Candidatus Gottesmanbacteria bacterium RBG_16_52_11]